MKSGVLHSYTYNLNFEKEFSNYIGSPYCLSVNSASMGLFAAFRSLGIQNGEVIISTMNWPGALWFFDLLQLEPVLADISLDTFTLCHLEVEQLINPKTKAILATDMLGYPCDWYRLRAIADAHNLPLMGDCAQSFGTFYDENPSGLFADVAVFSFGMGKIFSVGEGGMIVCRKSEDFEKLVFHFGHPDIQRVHLGRIKNFFSGNIRMNPGTAKYAKDNMKKVYEKTIERSSTIHAKFLRKSLDGDIPNYCQGVIKANGGLHNPHYLKPLPQDYLLVDIGEEPTNFPNTHCLYTDYQLINFNFL